MGRSRRSKSTGSYKEVEVGSGAASDVLPITESSSSPSDFNNSAKRLLEVCSQLRDEAGRPLLHESTSLTLSSALLMRLHQAEQHQQNSSPKKIKGNSKSAEATEDTHTSIRRCWLLNRDEESGYTALHWAIYRGDLAKMLLLLKDGLAGDSEVLDIVNLTQPRLKQRPILVLNGDVSAVIPSLMNEMISATDNEGLTPGQLLAVLQRQELSLCRKEAVYQPFVGTSHNNRGSRRNSFDLEDTVGDEQDEFDDLHQYMNQLNRSGHPNSFIVTDSMKDEDTSYGCEVFTFGRAHHCALGVGQDASDGGRKLRPQRVQEFGGRSGRAVAVAGAAHHTLVVTAEGHLYAFGLGKGGRLGTGDDSPCPRPRRVRGPLSTKKVVGVAAAENHSLCVTKCGEVYSFGSNRFGQLGTAEEGPRYLPRRVDDLKGIKCVAVAAGARHSVALSAKGEVYVWGDNSAGQLGILRRNGAQKVQRVEALWGSSKVGMQISASDQATLVLASASSTTMAVNVVYTFGHGNHAPIRVHFGNNEESTLFGGKTSRHHSRAINPVAIASARHHNVAICSNGRVYTWGLHSEALGNGSGGGERKNKSSAGRMIASPRLVTGMLPENGGGFAVAVSASENHTAVVTDTGALYTWGATSPQDVLGHQGVRWQPDPKRVPGVCRAVGVATAKEHISILIGTSYPPIPRLHTESRSAPSLEALATKEIAKYVDLFTVLPILLTAERTRSEVLKDFCLEFVRRNMDGVLNVAQKSVLDTYLMEHVMDNDLPLHSDDRYSQMDSSIHPLFVDTIVGTKTIRPFFRWKELSTFEEWTKTCDKILKTREAKLLMNRLMNSSEESRASYKAKLRKARSLSESNGRHDDESICSERCLELITNMDLSSKALTDMKHVTILRELRSTRKKLAQIQKLEDSTNQSDTAGKRELSSEQLEKVRRRPQLEADRNLLEPALQAVERRLRQLHQLQQIQAAAVASLKNLEEEKKQYGDSKCVDVKGNMVVDDSENVDLKAHRCTICEINCPDEKSYELHINGRKHRNRVMQVENEEKEIAAAKMAKEKQSQQLLKSSNPLSSSKLSSPPKKAWKDVTPPPKFKLPGPPHPVPDAVVSLKTTASPTHTSSSKDTKRISLMDIMREEEKQKPAKATNRQPRTAGLGSPLSKPPLIKSVSASPWGIEEKPKGKPHSLSDFLTPTKKAPPTASLATSSWGTPKASRATKSPVISAKRTSPAPSPGLSLLEIQKQEQDLKEKDAAHTHYDAAGPNGWYVERRERAGSFQELQRQEQQKLEERLFIEEQIRIEQMIRKEQEEAAAAVTKPKKKKHNGNKKKTPVAEKGSNNQQEEQQGTHKKNNKSPGGKATQKKTGPTKHRKQPKGGKQPAQASQKATTATL